MCGITPFQGVSSWVSMNHWSHQTGSLSLSFSLLPTLQISLTPLTLLPSPIPCHTPVPWGVCLGSARLISGGEEKANWELALAVNLTREGGEIAVATLPLQPSQSNSPPLRWKPLTCISMCRHTHIRTKVLNMAVCTQVFRCSLPSNLTQLNLTAINQTCLTLRMSVSSIYHFFTQPTSKHVHASTERAFP